MDSTFTLDIITPEHQYFADKVDEIILTSDLGELALKAHHLDLIANIVICPLVVSIRGHRYYYAISGGTLQFSHTENKASLFVYAIESVDEIDMDRALKAKANAEELRSTAQSRRDSTRAEIKLKRALNRINVKNAHNL